MVGAFIDGGMRYRTAFFILGCNVWISFLIFSLMSAQCFAGRYDWSLSVDSEEAKATELTENATDTAAPENTCTVSTGDESVQ